MLAGLIFKALAAKVNEGYVATSFVSTFITSIARLCLLTTSVDSVSVTFDSRYPLIGASLWFKK